MREHAVLGGSISRGEIAHEAIREELSRILTSSAFIQSTRLARFLRYTVETTLAGDAGILKEYLIGTEVYDRKPPYHPNLDSIVRSEARRLRNKLKQYYESDGKDDSVFIYYRLGSYVPAFRCRAKRESGGRATDLAVSGLLGEELFAEALKISSWPQNVDLQIVFEGTVRLSFPRAESPGLAESSPGQTVVKRIQFRKVAGMPRAKAD